MKTTFDGGHENIRRTLITEGMLKIVAPYFAHIPQDRRQEIITIVMRNFNEYVKARGGQKWTFEELFAFIKAALPKATNDQKP